MSKASILGVSCSAHKWNCGAILSLQGFNSMDSDLFMTRATFDAMKRFMESRLESRGLLKMRAPTDFMTFWTLTLQERGLRGGGGFRILVTHTMMHLVAI